MGISIGLFHGFGVELRWVEGEVIDEVFDVENDTFAWGFHMTLACFDILIGFKK